MATKRSSRRISTRSMLSLFLLASSSTIQALQLPLQPVQAPIVQHAPGFTLRHIFHRGTYRDPDLHRRLDIPPEVQNEIATTNVNTADGAAPLPPLEFVAEDYEIERLADRSWHAVEQYMDMSASSRIPPYFQQSQWTRDVVVGPNVTDKNTVINLALIAANSYVPKKYEGDWTNVTEGFNHSVEFGWEGDGLRGHIFADEGNKTIIIGLKGTSPAVFDGDGTTTRDKLNDNLLFSCCCAQGGQYFWRQVCDCQSGTYNCNATCLLQNLKRKTRYYSASIDLYNNVTELYPNSNIWIVGHSLGGSVSALLGLTFGVPVVTFEAPGDDLAAKRLGLPVPPSARDDNPHRGKYSGARHFGHTADPVFMGTCNSATSTCTLGGYAMESQCHTGLQCVYDTVADHNWRVGIGYHGIHGVIDNVLRKYNETPKCVPDDECIDCYSWKFFKSNGSESTTTSISATSTRATYTRTSTCETPGWWGCLDSTTTRPSSTHNIATTTYTTTTCVEPGWFGCNKYDNTTIITTTELPPSTTVLASTTAGSGVASTTCRPGWFGHGCSSPSISSSTFVSATSTSIRTRSDSDTCETPGIFFGCWDPHDSKRHSSQTATITKIPTSSAARPSSTISSITTTRSKKERRECKRPFFFGLICLDDNNEL